MGIFILQIQILYIVTGTIHKNSNKATVTCRIWTASEKELNLLLLHMWWLFAKQWTCKVYSVVNKSAPKFISLISSIISLLLFQRDWEGSYGHHYTTHAVSTRFGMQKIESSLGISIEGMETTNLLQNHFKKFYQTVWGITASEAVRKKRIYTTETQKSTIPL